MCIFEVSMYDSNIPRKQKKVAENPLSSGCLVSLNDLAFRETADESEQLVQSFN